MVYKIIVSPLAQKEIENAIDYYALYSTYAPVNFIAGLKEAASGFSVYYIFEGWLALKNLNFLQLFDPSSAYFHLSAGLPAYGR